MSSAVHVSPSKHSDLASRTRRESFMNAAPHHPLFYVLIACGVVLMVAVIGFAMTGGRLPGLINSPSADVGGKTAQ
jgi:hypothetical protein